MFVAAPASDHRLLRKVLARIRDEPESNLSVTALAAQAGVSERHLTRLFKTHLGTTPARCVRAARTEAAAQLLTSSALPIARIATRCGFTSAEALRQAVVDCYAVSPSQYRSMHSTAERQLSTPSTMTPMPSGTSSSRQNSANERGTT